MQSQIILHISSVQVTRCSSLLIYQYCLCLTMCGFLPWQFKEQWVCLSPSGAYGDLQEAKQGSPNLFPGSSEPLSLIRTDFTKWVDIIDCTRLERLWKICKSSSSMQIEFRDFCWWNQTLLCSCQQHRGSFKRFCPSRQNPAPEPGELISAYTYISSEGLFKIWPFGKTHWKRTAT